MVYSVAIYCRLSKDDKDKNDVSMSITNQLKFLTSYVREQGWQIFNCYIDDGISGTTFDRPNFKQMIKDIEYSRINLVITKDLSRLGRNYIETGQYTDFFFPNNNVRYIALNDGIDTSKDDNDIAPFKNIINEMYAKDISRKVRTTLNMLAIEGKFKNSRAPYGYLKSVEDKYLLVPDTEVADNVERIFKLYISGMTGRAIAELFNQEYILSPNEYFYNRINKANPYVKSKSKWSSATILNIIKNPAYYGAVANGKRSIKSFKNKVMIRNSPQDWVIVEDRHIPIIKKETWLEAQSCHMNNKKSGVRKSSDGEINIFSGILKCSDCGKNLVLNKKHYKSYIKEFFRCSTYMQKGKSACASHIVDYRTIYQAVLMDVQKYAVIAKDDEQALINTLLKSYDEFSIKKLKVYEKNILSHKKRIQQIDKLMQALFEEKVLGGVTESIYKRMMLKYESEQSELISCLEQLESEMNKCDSMKADIACWVGKIKSCLEIKELTRDIVVTLIERIEVSQTYKHGEKQFLNIDITYKFDNLHLCTKQIS